MLIVIIWILFVVNWMLLYAVAKICDHSGKMLRISLSALSGAILMYLRVLPVFAAIHPLMWRICALLITAWLAFGFTCKTIMKSVLFSLLHLSLGEIAGGREAFARVALGAAGLCLGCLILSRERKMIPVELSYAGQTVHLTALRDNGNLLRDPITSRPVLIIGADIATKLTGLSSQSLNDPVNTMGAIPGLQLIPYQTVGNTGFMLALTIRDTKIGNRQGSTLVAFSPLVFKGNYQALTGGTE